MRYLVTIAVALATAFVAPAAHAQGIMNGPGYWQCQSYMGNSDTVYFSAVFDGTADQPVGVAFIQMLADKYGFKGGGSCGIAWKSGTTIDKLRAGQKSSSAQLRAAGKKVIETGWVYAAAAKLRYWCYGIVSVSGQGMVKNYSYETSVFEVPGADSATLQRRWNTYLKSRHTEPAVLVALANCTAAQPDPARTDAAIKGWGAQYASKTEMVHSDWSGE